MQAYSLQAALEFLDSWLEYRARQVDIPGFCVAIYHEDSLVFSHAYGLANVTRGELLSTNHLFRMASQTKMFTATAILQLTDTGQLRLDDYAIDYLPWLSAHHDRRMSKISIRQLLAHSSGLVRDGSDSDFWELKQPFPDVNALKKIILNAEIATEPNLSVKYSNLSYALLGQVIQSASKQTPQAYIRRHIIKPLALRNVFTDLGIQIVPRVSTGYSAIRNYERRALEPQQSTKAFASAIGIYATVEDMCRFAAVHFYGNELILSDQLKKEAHHTQTLVTSGWNTGIEFGLGFRMQTSPYHRLLGHDGHLFGHLSATFFDPFARIAVAVAANAQDAPSIQIVNGIFESLDWFTHNLAAVIPPKKARFSARLRSDTSSVDVIATANNLVAVDPASWTPFARPEILEPVDAHSLRIVTPGNYEQLGELITYTFDTDVVRAVKYAGLTMIPETGYYGCRPEQLIAHGSDTCLTLEDLAAAQLCVGYVMKVEPCRGKLPYRVLVNFRSGLVRYCYASHLPRNVHKNDLVGKQVLGAMFKVWHFGKIKYEVVALGLAIDQHTSIRVGSSDLLALTPDPAYPRTMGAQYAIKTVDNFYDGVRYSTFKFEARPEYPPEEIVFHGDSLAAWYKGKIRHALALIDGQPDPEYHVIPRKLHIMVVDDTLTSFQKWSLERKKRLKVPAPKDKTTFLLPRKYLQHLVLPEGDFAIWDEKWVSVNSYHGTHWTHTSIYDTGTGNDLSKFLKLERRLIRLAVKHGTKL